MSATSSSSPEDTGGRVPRGVPVLTRSLAETHLVLEPISGEMRALDETAWRIFAACDGTTATSDIAHGLVHGGAAVDAHVLADVALALDELAVAGFVTWVEGPSTS